MRLAHRHLAAVLPLLALACLACSEPDSTGDAVNRGAMLAASAELAEARSISDPEKRARELARIASAAAFLQEDDAVLQAFRDAFAAGLEVDDLDRQSYLLSQVLGYVQASRLDDEAAELARSHPVAWVRGELMAGVGRRAAAREREWASALLEEALAAARGESDPIRRGTALAAIGKDLVTLGFPEQGQAALAAAERDALAVEDFWATRKRGTYGRGTAVYLTNAIVYGYVEGGQGERARQFIARVGDEKLRKKLLGDLQRFEKKR